MGTMIQALVQAEDRMHDTPCLGCMTKGLEIAALHKKLGDKETELADKEAQLKAAQQLDAAMDEAIEHIARIERNPDGIER